MTFHTKSQSLDALQQKESIKRRQSRSSVALGHSPAPGHKGGVAVMIDVNNAVVSNLRLVEHVELFGILAPRKFPTVYDHSAQRGAMAAHKLGHRVNDYVGAIFDWPQQNRSGDRVVDD